ncbi:MAG: NAD(P)-binding protein [Acidobacteria bacterium]|nr:NAD(P)-binding protein [Acidobacteriota bacterium]
MTNVVILGGGLTGLVAAERLALAGVTAVVIERESEPGGACRSFDMEGFTFDVTGHLLHVRREETGAYLRELGIWDRLAVHERRAAVVIGGRTTPYPVQINMGGLAPEVRRDCLLGFIRAWCRRDEGGGSAATFREWVLERFGDGLARHFFFPYNTKLFRAAPEELSLDWIGRYVPKPTLEEVVDGALGLERRGVGYNAVFRYPARGGIRMVPDAVARRVAGLKTGVAVTSVDLERRRVTMADGHAAGFELLVATISLPSLIDLLTGPLPEEVAEARRALRWVRILNVALGVEGPAPSAQHWLYFADPPVPFYRIGFPSNHGRLAPEACHTVSIEVSLDPGSGDATAVAAEAEAAAAAVGLLDREKIRVRMVNVIDPGYVVFDHRRRDAVAALRRFLGDRGVIVAGRWAEWKYSAMEDAILDGMNVARRIAGEPGA